MIGKIGGEIEVKYEIDAAIKSFDMETRDYLTSS